jgi:hypothetical protein
MMGAMVREKIERERERGLQEYLNAVLERCTDDQCLLLAKFLRVNKHINALNDACSNGSGSPCPSFAINMSHVSQHSQVNAPKGCWCVYEQRACTRGLLSVCL